MKELEKEERINYQNDGFNEAVDEIIWARDKIKGKIVDQSTIDAKSSQSRTRRRMTNRRSISGEGLFSMSGGRKSLNDSGVNLSDAGATMDDQFRNSQIFQSIDKKTGKPL